MNAGFCNIYEVTCVRDGVEIWKEEVKNLVTQEGLDHLLNTYFNGAAYTATHFLALKTGTPIIDSTTLATFVATYETTLYEGLRKEIDLGSPTAGSEALSRQVDNSGNPCLFSINDNVSVTGVGVCTVDTGDAGVLFSGADFAAPRPLIAGDMLSITCTFTQKSY